MEDYCVLLNTDSLWPKEITCCSKLWYQGNIKLLSQPGVSIVGTRNPDQTGIARTLECTDILGPKYTIISGLALGVDSIAHTEALNKGFSTIAVIGTPIDKCYPKEHEKLQQLIAQKGLVISMFEPGTKVEKYFFMKRNLLMSQISKASVVTQADIHGGAMGQAGYTLKQGKKVYTFDFENHMALKESVLVSSAKTIILDCPEQKLSAVQPELF